jgi:DnaJ-class molecular chaperone
MAIKICDKCGGEGKIHYSDRFDSYEETCKNCNGHGRIRRYEFAYEVTLDVSAKEINSVQEEVFSAIRKKRDFKS